MRWIVKINYFLNSYKLISSNNFSFKKVLINFIFYINISRLYRFASYNEKLTFADGDGVLSGLLLLQLKFVGTFSLLIFSLFGDFFIDKFSATLLLKFDGEGALLKSCGPIASPDLRLGRA